MGELHDGLEFLFSRNYTVHEIGLGAALIAVLIGARLWSTRQRLPEAPIISLSNLPGAAGTAADITAYVKNGSVVMQAGWDRYSKKGLHYLIKTPTETLFVVAPQFTEEIRLLPDSKVSAMKANSEIMQFRHTLHPRIEVDQYHNLVVQRQLTQSLGPFLPDIVDEAKKAFAEELGKFKEPCDVVVWDVAFRIVTRTANRLLFGKELCRNPEFLRLSIDFSFVMFGGADIIRTYPEILKPLVMWWKTSYGKTVSRLHTLLVPPITERLAQMEKHEREGTVEEWNKVKPNDAIQWVLDITPLKDRDPDMLLYRMLHINIAAVHTSSVTFLDCVYELAARPEIHQELRNEIRGVFAEERHQWRKQGLTKLVKMDSFMRETVRFNPLFSSNLDRIALQDFKLSDGTLVPKGTYLTVPSLSMYMDNAYYENAHEFDAFRFARLRQEPGQERHHSFVQTQATYLHFGHGKHACPGRFFAANEIKILLVLALSNYDISLPEPNAKPEPIWFTKGRTPNPNGVIRWKLRTDAPDYAAI